MSALALGLILTAAIAHATWNLLAKRVGGGAAFLWLFGTVSAVIYAPLALIVVIVQRPTIGATELTFIAGSAVLHLVYFLLLQGGYRSGDLSLVYPLARGTGPLLSVVVAIAILGERPSLVAIAGTLLIVGGVVLLTGGVGGLRRGWSGGVAYGLACGTVIATYTLWDKQAVSALLIPPLLLDWGAGLGRVILLTPIVRHQRDQIRHHWHVHRLEVLGVAVLSSAAYILVLTALAVTPVSYVAPAREISILIGTAMGTRLLAEGDTRRRLTAAAAMVLGVVALALG